MISMMSINFDYPVSYRLELHLVNDFRSFCMVATGHHLKN